MMDDRLLIDLIKNQPILYDPGHKSYMDLGMKVAVWEEIGAKMNTGVERCKQRWNNIRDNYKKSLKKLMHHKTAKPYRFAWQLSFLKRFMDERDLRGNHSSQLNMTAVDYKKSEDEKSEESLSQPEVVDEEETTKEGNNRSISTTPGYDVYIPVPTDQPRIAKKRKVARESASSVLMKYLLEKKPAEGSAAQNQAMVNIEHPVDAFLFSLSSSLKSLQPNLLMLAKSEIFACVQKYERKRHIIEGYGSDEMVFEESQECEGKGPITGGNMEQRLFTKECRTSQVSPTATEPPLQKRKRTDSTDNPNELLKLACELLSSSSRQPEEANDEYQALAKLWTLKLKVLEPKQKRFAERAINEVFFEADSGTLHRNSLQINHLSEPASVTTSHSSHFTAARAKSLAGSQSPVMRPASNSHCSTAFWNAIPSQKTEVEDSFS